jgi:hypothetical protein
LYEIVEQLLNGSKDRYSNKNKFVRKLNKKETKQLFKQVLNDSNYDWDFNENLPFIPSVQILLKHENSQFMFLYSKSTGQMSIIDVEGYQVFKINEGLVNYFDSI